MNYHGTCSAGRMYSIESTALEMKVTLNNEEGSLIGKTLVHRLDLIRIVMEERPHLASSVLVGMCSSSRMTIV